MNPLRPILPAILMIASLAHGQIKQPYTWSHSSTGSRLTIEAAIPSGAYLYADRTSIDVEGLGAPLSTPVTHTHSDDFGSSAIYEGGQSHRWVYRIDPEKAARVTIHYQGCGTPPSGGGAVCYPPTTETFTLGSALPSPSDPSMEPFAGNRSLETLFDRFEIVRTDGGMKNSDAFLAFLNLDQAISPPAAGLLAGKNGLIVVLLVLLGGLALNLTPCVLPMIPVNLSIIGAGAAAATKRQGFVRGGVYGLGIALAYGGLGIFAVLTGSKFGTLNASSTFNFIMGAVFVVLALAMFDVLSIDLTRFGSKFGVANEKRGRLIPAFMMGVVAALLAGACVAPIVIAVLLQATTMYAAGNPMGLFLPLLLGVGMALPWPVAGAGMTILPKPGQWMSKVKHGFGVLVALLGLYYSYLGVELLSSRGDGSSTSASVAQLENGLRQALADDQPVFIDFWASWCKNCLTMNATTFKDENVIQRLHHFQEIRFHAENPGDPEIKRIMDRYNLPGLPGYVILKPKT